MNPWHTSDAVHTLPALVMAVAIAPSLALLAQEEVPIEKQEQAEFLAAARNYRLRLPNQKGSATLREPSLLNFTNPERNQERGSVFVWLHEKRPVAVGQFFCFNNPKGRLTKHAFHSLAASPLVAEYDGQTRWSPKAPGIAWIPVPDAPEPAATHASRLLQMRQIARRYRLTLMTPKGEKSELRLTARPLFDYEALQDGVLSGAILSFVIATDPEAILLLEAVSDNGTSSYRCGFTRFHFQQIVAMDGEQEVWHVDYDPTLINNRAGDPATMQKIYNSFVP